MRSNWSISLCVSIIFYRKTEGLDRMSLMGGGSWHLSYSEKERKGTDGENYANESDLFILAVDVLMLSPN